MPSSAPTSSSVCGGWPSSPKRRTTTCCMRGLSARSPPRARRERAWSAVAPSGDSDFSSSIRSANMLSPSPTGVSSETGSSTSSNSSPTRCSGKPDSVAISSIEGSRFSFWASWRRERWHAPHLLGDVHRQADRAALVGERARDRLADPPRRVRRELVAQLVVELLDRADQAEVALLDQVEQRHAGLRVVARDRHDEPQVRTRSAAAWRASSPRSLRRASSRSSAGVSSRPSPIWRT